MKGIIPYKRITKYYETDKMGVVHHSNYIRWFEESRIDFLAQAGLEYAEMEEMGLLIPVLSSHTEYIKPVKFNDVVLVIPKIESFSGLKFEVSYKVVSKDNEILYCRGRTSHCFLDSSFNPVKLKKDYNDVYTKMNKWVGVEI